MKIRACIAAAGAAAILGTGTLALPAVASASTTTHTLGFTSIVENQVMFTKESWATQDTDVNASGKAIGFDMLYFAATSATSASVKVTGALNGGFLYATGTVNLKTGAFSNGTVTGGTGSFKGATGTLTAKRISDAKTAVTIKYST